VSPQGHISFHGIGSHEEPTQTVEVTVHDYFVNTKQTPLQFRDELCDTGFRGV
jgi:hypothetical protein